MIEGEPGGLGDGERDGDIIKVLDKEIVSEAEAERVAVMEGLGDVERKGLGEGVGEGVGVAVNDVEIVGVGDGVRLGGGVGEMVDVGDTVGVGL